MPSRNMVSTGRMPKNTSPVAVQISENSAGPMTAENLPKIS